MNTYCWIHGTFTVPASMSGTIGEHMPHPGVGPTTDPNLVSSGPIGDRKDGVCLRFHGQKSSSQHAAISAMLDSENRN